MYPTIASLCVCVFAFSYLITYPCEKGYADLFNVEVIKEREETTDAAIERTTETHLQATNAEIEDHQAGFLHRTGTLSAPAKCVPRARLTPSNPSTVRPPSSAHCYH